MTLFYSCHKERKDKVTENVTFLSGINVQNAQKNASKTVKNVKNKCKQKTQKGRYYELRRKI